MDEHRNTLSQEVVGSPSGFLREAVLQPGHCEDEDSQVDLARLPGECSFLASELNAINATTPQPLDTLATVAGLVSAADKLSGTSQLSDSVALQPLSVASCGSSALVSSAAVIEDNATVFGRGSPNRTPYTVYRMPSAARA